MGEVVLTDQECKTLHGKTRTYTVLTAGIAAASGGSGLTASLFDSTTPRYVTGGISLVLGIGSAVIGTLLKFAGDDFATYCKIKPNE